MSILRDVPDAVLASLPVRSRRFHSSRWRWRMNDEVHIASFVARHLPGNAAALDGVIAQWPGLELARQEETQSILLHECGGSRELLACMDALQGVAGMISVNLIYHHAEPRASLDEIMTTKN